MAAKPYKHLSSLCPCGSAATYADCCQPVHQGAAARDAEQLMRSRYSAYVLQNDTYLLRSWHPRTRPASISHEDGIRWLGLKIIKHTHDGTAHARVSFEARYRVGGGSAVRMREDSRFVLEDGHWYYVDGEFSDA